VRFRGLRIAGLSGIFDSRHFHQAHYEAPPYNANSLRSVYHTRRLEVLRLLELQPSLASDPLDVFLSHDWPQGIAQHGDVAALLRIKPYFRAEVEQGTLGSPPLRQLLSALQPAHWFAAHLHVRFPATVLHEPAAIPSAEAVGSGERRLTRFLALDKVVPGRSFLQFLSLPSSRPHPPDSSNSSSNSSSKSMQGAYGDDELHFDAAFVGILRSTHFLDKPTSTLRPQPATTELQEPQELLARRYGPALTIPPMRAALDSAALEAHLQTRGNLQTDALLEALQLPHLPPWTVPVAPALAQRMRQLYACDWDCASGEQAQPREDVGDPNALDI
jgi:hypothetical protein